MANINNNHNRLKDHQFYLSGCIDRVVDRGVGWRNFIKEFLFSLDIGALDPCDKPISFGAEDEENFKWRKESKERAKLLYEHGHIEDAHNICESIANAMKMVVAADLRMLDMSHAVIMHLDLDIHTCGTYCEMTYACLERKPIIVHCEQGKMATPDWILGMIPHEFIFSTWDEVKDYIRHVAFSDNVKHFKRWRFFDFDKIYNRKINE